MSTDNPDVSEIEVKELVNKPFAVRKDFRIEVSNKAYETICSHAKEDTTVEICGVLIGEVYKDNEGPYLEIIGAIRGEYADNKMVEVRFTQETWSHINNVKDTEYPDKKIVGWYHSHPRFGVFLSTQDQFIHKNFFSQPWQVAFVIDPHSNEEGFFVWHNGTPLRSEYFWLEGSKKTSTQSIKNTQDELIEEINANVKYVSKKAKKILRPLHFVIGLLILILSLLLTYAILNRDINQLLNPFTNYIRTETTTDVTDLKKIISENSLLSNLNVQFIRRGSRVWCFGEVYTYFQQQLILRTVGSQPNIESVDIRGIFPTHRYYILPGETLGSISKKIYGTSFRWNDILQMNREKIPNPNKIQPFITIELPE